MARRRRIDARCDDGGDLLDERAGVDGDPGERSDVSRSQRFTRGDGAGQHHRALSTLGIFVLMGVGGFSARGVRGFVVVCRWGFGWLLQDRSARGAAARGDVGPREGQEGEEGDGASHGGRCWGGVGGGQVVVPVLASASGWRGNRGRLGPGREPRSDPRWTRDSRLGRLVAMPAVATAPAGIDPERRMVSDE